MPLNGSNEYFHRLCFSLLNKIQGKRDTWISKIDLYWIGMLYLNLKVTTVDFSRAVYVIRCFLFLQKVQMCRPEKSLITGNSNTGSWPIFLRGSAESKKGKRWRNTKSSWHLFTLAVNSHLLNQTQNQNRAAVEPWRALVTRANWSEDSWSSEGIDFCPTPQEPSLQAVYKASLHVSQRLTSF